MRRAWQSPIPANANTCQAEVLLQDNLDFSTLGLVGIEVGVGTGDDDNDVIVTSGLTGVEASLSAGFSAFGVQIGGTISAAYSASGGNAFSFGGSVSFERRRRW